MAAAKALLGVLENAGLAMDNTKAIEVAIKRARQHHMGCEQLLKLRREFFGDETPELTIPDDENQVEWIVRDIVDRYRTKDAMASQEIDEKDEGSKQQPSSVPKSGRTVITVEEDERTLCGLLQAKRLAQEAALTRADQESESDSDCQNTVSDPILTVILSLQQAFENEQKEAKARETRFKKEMAQMNEVLLGLTTLMEAQASSLQEERAATEELKSSFAEFRAESNDREVRYTRLVSSLTSRVHDLEETIDEMKRELKDDAQQSENRISAALAKIKLTSPKPKNQHNQSMPVQSEKVTPRSGSKPTPVSEKTAVEEKGNEEPAPTGARDRSDRNQHEVHGDANDRTPAPKALETDGDDLRENPWRIAAKKGKEKSFSESLRAPPRTSEAKQLRGSGQIRRAVYYLRGISPECTAVDIQRYCDQRRIRVSSCRILQTRRFGTNAARLSVAQIDAEKEGMMSEDFWPEHITIRPWVFPEEGEIITDSRRN